ncbi:MAG: 3-isopropylmalate dehydratase [Nitrososphaeria archaeon]|nr:3-isopropylmalate dehydratase [Nitrososphaeria archaeon]
MKISGKCVKLGDHINTDLIISGKYKYRTQDIRELAKYVFEDLDPKLKDRLYGGSIIVAQKNFGCGSSREQAPRVLKAAGVNAVIAESFARIFFRNAVNVGLPVIVSDKEFIMSVKEDETLSVDLSLGKVYALGSGLEASIKPYPEFMLKIIEAGGIAEYFKAFKRFPWENI